jgi:predicted ester cyclase
MSEANKELVSRHFEQIFNLKNFDACDELIAEDYVEHALAPFGDREPGRVNGLRHVRAVAEWLQAQFPDGHMTIEAIVSEGDMVAARVHGEGTNLGKLNGSCRRPASGSHRARVTGSGLRAVGWLSTGPRAMT